MYGDHFNVLSKELFGKLYADKGCISKTLFETLFNDRILLVTGLKSNIKNKLMSLRDKILLQKRSVIETINDELKNIAHAVHSRHSGLANFLMNMISTIMAYCIFSKKTAIKWVIEKQNQLELFI